MSDLCKEKKFLDLNSDIFVVMKRGELASFLDEKDNCWTKGRVIGEGSFGKVVEYKSHNKDYTDLVIKFYLDKEDMKHETKIVNFFNLHRCKYLIRSGVKMINKKDPITIMERIDGDIYRFRFDKPSNGIKIFQKLVQFLVSTLSCALRKNYYYPDLKEENIGYKLCKDSTRFTLLDLGSFVKKSEKSPPATYKINDGGYDKGYFDAEMLSIYSLLITVLNCRLKTYNHRAGMKFEKFEYEELEKEKGYPKTSLLADKNYQKLKSKYYSYFKKKDEFVEVVFQILKTLTKKHITLGTVLRKLDYYK